MKYRKRPIDVEAVQWTADEPTDEWAAKQGISFFDDGDRSWPVVHTLEGTMRMEPEDWLITGAYGEKYPCKPDIFDGTYEPVIEPQP